MNRTKFVAVVVGLVLAVGMVLQIPEAGQAQAAQAMLLARGLFGGAIDVIHHANGTASVYRLSDGSRLLRLENFKSTNGPNLYVYLSGNASPRNSAQLSEAGDFEVSPLKGNIGNQNYPLPAGLDLSKFKSVVIYCKHFHVVFGSAPLVQQ
jgi:Electron transfer DM13